MKTALLNSLSGVALLAVIPLMSSCGNGNATQDSSIAFETYQTGQFYTLTGSAADYQRDTDLSFYDSVSIVMPTRLGDIDITALKDSITDMAFEATNVQAIVPTINRWLTKTANEQGYKARLTSGNPETASGFCYLNGYVVYLSGDMLVYCVKTDVYNPGAAHGMYDKRYINFYMPDNNTGQVVTLSDIFTPQGLKKLPELIAEQTSNMSDMIGPTEVDGLPDNNNFFISSEGKIVMAYQPYEIASYAQGIINFPFEPYELVELMTPLGIKIFNLEDFYVTDDVTSEPTPDNFTSRQ